MMRIKLIAVLFAGLLIGLSIGFLSFQSDFSANTTYPIEVSLVQAYFKVYNTTTESGVGYNTLASYVIVLNVTNPSNTKLRLTNVQIDENNHIFSYWRDFSKNNDYWFDPDTSRLIAFAQTSGLTGLANDAFQSHNLFYTLSASFLPVDGHGHAGIVTDGTMQLRNTGTDEYVYGQIFKDGSYFKFINENGNIDVGITQDQIG